MKSVLASLKPYYYYLVGEGIKKIEVRKGMPQAEDWDKDTFFYMSKDEKSFAKIPKEFQEKYRKHFGKVGLRFVCDNVIQWNYKRFITMTGTNDTYFPFRDDLKSTCLTYEEFESYGKGETLYGWHITDLKIYDKPKELSEFKNLKRQPIQRAFQSWGYCYEKEN